MKLDKNSQYYLDMKTHVLKRIRTRFPAIECNSRTENNVHGTIKGAAKRGIFIEKSSKSRNVYLSKAFGEEMLIVYDHHREIPITVMPKEWRL